MVYYRDGTTKIGAWGRDVGMTPDVVGVRQNLKHIPVVELVFVASGFLLRVLGGAAATHVPPSAWFLLVCSLGALGVAVAKRYAELAGLAPAAYLPRRCRRDPRLRSYGPHRRVPAAGAAGRLQHGAVSPAELPPLALPR